MKHLPYKTYKNSGIQWIDEVPSSWEISKIKWHSRVYSGNDSPSIDGEYPLIGANGVIGSSDSYSLEDSAVLMGRVGSAGLINYITSKSGVSDNALIFSNFPSVDARYLYYFLLSDNFELDISKTAQPLITASRVKEHFLCIPSLVEQKAIVNFLDRETSKIDELSQKQERLIELLAESRIATISNAVSFGINQNINTKQTGAIWQPEIPNHWQIKKIKQTSYLKGRVGWKGLTSDEYLVSGYAYLVTGTDFKKKYIDWKNCYCVAEERYIDDPFIQLRENDLLITKDGTIGKLALVKNLDAPACLNSGIFLLRPENSYITDFMYWVLSSSVFNTFCDLSSMGSTIQHLYQNVFEEFAVGLPSIEEQVSIVKYLEEKISKIDALITKSQHTINLLTEHRQSLISAAVTGKIDVGNQS